MEFRARAGAWGYKNISLLKYTEEAIAETYGSKNILKGIMFPIKEGYVTPSNLLKEAGIAGFGGYALYWCLNQIINGEE